MPRSDDQQVLRNRLADACEWAKTNVVDGEQYKATIILRFPHSPDRDVIVTDDTNEAIIACLQKHTDPSTHRYVDEPSFNAGFDAVGRAMKVKGWKPTHPKWVADRRAAFEKFKKQQESR